MAFPHRSGPDGLVENLFAFPDDHIALFKRRGGLIVCNNEGCGYERVAEKKPRGRKKAEKTDE